MRPSKTVWHAMRRLAAGPANRGAPSPNSQSTPPHKRQPACSTSADASQSPDDRFAQSRPGSQWDHFGGAAIPGHAHVQRCAMQTVQPKRRGDSIIPAAFSSSSPTFEATPSRRGDEGNYDGGIFAHSKPRSRLSVGWADKEDLSMNSVRARPRLQPLALRSRPRLCPRLGLEPGLGWLQLARPIPLSPPGCARDDASGMIILNQAGGVHSRAGVGGCGTN